MLVRYVMLVRSQGISLRKLVELSLYCRILSAYLLNNKLSPTERPVLCYQNRKSTVLIRV